MTLLQFLVTLLWCLSKTGGSRQKRIIMGGIVDWAPLGYEAVKYTVWIGDGRIAPARKHWYSLFADVIVAQPPHLWCTGVLLTPDIVQTTCSCVSFFLVNSYSSDYYRVKATVMSAWEDRLQVFFGETIVRRMKLFINAKSYIVYNQCAKVFLPAIDDPQRYYLSYIVHDYGLIVMEKKVSEAPTAEISYAPPMPFQDIITFYHEALKREYTCLMFGYGHANETKTYGIPGWGDNSKDLRYYWRSIINYQDCYYATYKDPVDRDVVLNEMVDFDYVRDATWMCANSARPKTLPELASTSPKDRGGPVTCNGVYLGMISNSFWYRTAHYQETKSRPFLKLTLFAPIVFTLWESSANYREEFLQDISKKLWTGETFPDPFDEIIHWRPTYILFSSCSTGIGSSYILLIFVSILELLH